MSDNPSSTEIQRTPPRKGDKVEVVRILILAVVSFVLGFGLVIFFLGPSDSKSSNDLPVSDEKAVADNTVAGPVESGAFASSGSGAFASSGSGASQGSGTGAPTGEAAATASLPSAGYGPGSASDNPLLSSVGAAQADSTIGAASESGGAAPGESAEAASVNEADAPPEVPPGKTPDDVAMDGGAFYLKCLDKNGAETKGDACDKLSVIEKRVATRLYVVDRCKKKHSGDKAQGKLSLGIEVDFDKPAVNFWNGPSSTLENAAKVAICLRTELNGLPIRGVSHKYSRYKMFFTVLFGDAKALAASKSASDKDKAAASSSKEENADASKSAGKGKLVKVVKDQVRVRKSPKDGEVIGKIGKDNEVRMLQKKGEWCKVLTPNNNEGWMICDAISQ